MSRRLVELPRTHNARINIRGLVDFMNSVDLPPFDSTETCVQSLSLAIIRRMEESPAFEAKFVFSMFDSDDDGRLERSDFKEICSFFLGTCVPALVISRLWTRLDSDGDGLASYDDFWGWLAGNELIRKGSPNTRIMRTTRHSKLHHDFRSLLQVYLYIKNSV